MGTSYLPPLLLRASMLKETRSSGWCLGLDLFAQIICGIARLAVCAQPALKIYGLHWKDGPPGYLAAYAQTVSRRRGRVEPPLACASCTKGRTFPSSMKISHQRPASKSKALLMFLDFPSFFALRDIHSCLNLPAFKLQCPGFSKHKSWWCTFLISSFGNILPTMSLTSRLQLIEGDSERGIELLLVDNIKCCEVGGVAT